MQSELTTYLGFPGEFVVLWVVLMEQLDCRSNLYNLQRALPSVSHIMQTVASTVGTMSRPLRKTLKTNLCFTGR